MKGSTALMVAEHPVPVDAIKREIGASLQALSYANCNLCIT